MEDQSDDIVRLGVEGLARVSTFKWDIAREQVEFSAGALALFGIDMAPHSIAALHALVHPEDRLRVEAETTAFLETGSSLSHEYRVQHADGTSRHVFCHVSKTGPVRTGEQTVHGLLIDVTQERQETHAVDMVKSEPVHFGFYEYNLTDQTSEWSPGLREMLRLAPSVQITADQLRECVHPEDRAQFDARMVRAVHSSGRYEFTFRILTASGEVRWIRDRGESHGPFDPQTGRAHRITGTLSDETESVAAQSVAHETVWRMLDTAPFGVYAVDADLRIVRISEGGKAAFAGVDSMIGRDVGEVLRVMWPEPFASEAIGHFRNTLATGEPYRAPQLVAQRRDRRVVEAYDWGVERIRLPDGTYGLICHFYDLTRRVNFEMELLEQERRLSLAYDAADMGAWDVDLVTGDTFWTPQIYRLFGVDKDLGTPEEIFVNVVHPDDLATINEAYSRAMEERQSFTMEFRIRKADGEVRYIVCKGEPVCDSAGNPVRMIGVNVDITEVKQTELALRASEERLRVVIDNTLAFVGVLGVDGVLNEANALALNAAGLVREDVVGRPFWETYWWNHDADVVARLQSAVEKAGQGETVRYDETVRLSDGLFITIDFLLAPVLDEAGKVTMLVASGFDVSERESVRQRVQDLLGEINHRSKNILTLVQIVARQTARAGADGFMERFEKRIHSLAAAQDLLVSSESDQVELASLAHAQMAHFDAIKGDRIRISGPLVHIGPRAAQTIGMALHELATNAGKYGALSNETGRIDLLWSLETGDDGQSVLHVNWAERGGPPVRAPESRGFGSSVIEQMTRANLDAEVCQDFHRDGVTWRMSCPVANLF